MITKYQYTTAVDTGMAKTLIPLLTAEIDADATILGGGFSTDHIDVNVTPGKTDVYMSDALPAPEKAALDAVILAHQAMTVDMELGCAFSTVKTDLAIVEDATWQEIEGVVITPGIFKKKNLADVIVVLSGEYNGDGGQLRLVENKKDAADLDILAAPHVFADSLGAWTRFQIMSDVEIRQGNSNTYQVWSQLNGAIALSLRYCTISFVLLTADNGHA